VLIPIHTQAEARAEEDKGVEVIGSIVEEEQETVAIQKIPKQEEGEKVKQPKKKKASKSRRRKEEFGVTDIQKQLEKQTNYLARAEHVLQPFRKLATSLDVQSKMVKEIASSVKQLQRQIIQIQKTIQKEKTRSK
jgi:hypothetical protein